MTHPLLLIVYGFFFIFFFVNFLRVVLSPVGSLPKPLRWNVTLTNIVAIVLGVNAFIALRLFLITIGELVSHWRG